ncbi:MAG: hypothetical protein HRU70_01635 [Phycisphaeraceae bacterium]|nr:MAG: hypothetical protein HRU70_01635 [Phycisphaeraceae bacterium]
MADGSVPHSFGPYELTRPLPPSRHGLRQMAVHRRTQTSHVVHTLAIGADRSSVRRVLAALERLSASRLPHALPISDFALIEPSGVRVVTPHVGAHDSLFTISDLARGKGGRLTPSETTRAIEHLLEAFDAGQRAGVHHGHLGPDEVLVDSRGSVHVEFYGMAFLIASQNANVSDPDPVESAREVRRVADIAFQLVTGAQPPPGGVFARDLAGLGRGGLAAWFGRALDPLEGFANASDALHALRNPPPATPEGLPRLIPTVRSALGFRSALGRRPR